jgi:hypothetical protein
MIKNFLLALVLTSVAIWMGCARGLQSIANVVVSTSPANQAFIAVSLPVNFVATINGTASTAVNWTLSSSSCTGNACGTFVTTPQGITYTAPTTLPSGLKKMAVTVTATSQSDSVAQGSAVITVLPISVCVAPPPISSGAATCATNNVANVGAGLSQQFAATTLPDSASQTFTWSLSCTQAGACGTLTQDANISGLAVYTAPATLPPNCTTSSCVTVTATSTLNQTHPSSGSSDVTVIKSRVLTGTSYVFRFSGYDTANNRVLMAGAVSFSTLNTGGAVSGGTGVIDVVNGPGSASAGAHQYNITAGSYTPSALPDNNTNNAGTLSLTWAGATSTTYAFQAVVNSAGEIRMIESDANGAGSGVMQRSAFGQFNSAKQTFAFVLSGVDSSGKRVGLAGLLPFDGTATATTLGNIGGGMMDLNDGGTATPFTGVTGTYGPIVPGSFIPVYLSTPSWTFDLYVGSGQAVNGKTPLTVFAISTNQLVSTQPALAGVMSYQDSSVTYDKTALASSAVSHLDGLSGSNTSVSLVVATGDANGNISGSFDSNNAGTLVSNQSFTCTYSTDPSNAGRYVVNLLGNSSSCGGTPLPFVFYASGANRGYLLDQSSAAVLVGGMDVQGSNLSAAFANSALPGTYAAATVGDADSSVVPLAANVLLVYQGLSTQTTAGTLYQPGPVTGATGTYSIVNTGTGTISLTPPGAANADSFIFYAIDTTHFWMFEMKDATTGNVPANPAVILMQE